MATPLTVRLDDDAERALQALTAGGRTRTEAVRSALLDAERALRRSELRAWAQQLNEDPAEVAAAQALVAELDDSHAG